VLHGHGHSCFLADDIDLSVMLRAWLSQRDADPGAMRVPTTPIR